MPVDTHLAAVHARVNMGLSAAEQTIEFMRKQEVFRVRVTLQQVIGNLNHAHDYLLLANSYPKLTAYVEELITFYQGVLAKAVRPMQLPALAGVVYEAQGSLLAADPFIQGGIGPS